MDSNRESLFWSKVSKESKCWLFTGHKAKNGYGQFWDGKQAVYAHRFAWESEYGPIPKDQVICHLCDNPACCNPEHLVCGTQKFNVYDSHRKGRSNTIAKLHPKFLVGELWLIKRLSVENTERIDLKYKFPASLIARMFKTTKQTIYDIWKSDVYLCKEGYYINLN